MTRTPRLAVDMDQVIVDTLARYQIWYARDFGAPLPVAALVGKGFKVAVPEAHQAQVQSYAHHPDFFRDLTPFVGSIDVLRRLAQRYELCIATAAMEFSNSFGAKFDWLETHLPFVPWTHRIFCGHKHLLDVDYLLDDTPLHFDGFRGHPLLFDAHHNVHETRYERLRDWDAVAARLLA